MPEFLEKKLKKQYGNDSDIPYKIMNKIGAMHGNKITAKGEEMEKKHNEDVTHKAAENVMKAKKSFKKKK